MIMIRSFLLVAVQRKDERGCLSWSIKVILDKYEFLLPTEKVYIKDLPSSWQRPKAKPHEISVAINHDRQHFCCYADSLCFRHWPPSPLMIFSLLPFTLTRLTRKKMLLLSPHNSCNLSSRSGSDFSSSVFSFCILFVFVEWGWNVGVDLLPKWWMESDRNFIYEDINTTVSKPITRIPSPLLAIEILDSNNARATFRWHLMEFASSICSSLSSL